MESTLQTAYKVHLKTICILYHLRVHYDKNRELSLKGIWPLTDLHQSKHEKEIGGFIEKDCERTEDLIGLSKSKGQLKTLD